MKNEKALSIRETFEREADRISDGNGRYPGFYQCKNRIRFELTPDTWNPVRRCYEWNCNMALERAMKIYARLPAKPGMLRLEMYPSVRYARSFKKQLYRLCERAGLGKPACIAHMGPSVVPSLDWDNEMEEGALFYWYLTPSFRPGILFKELLYHSEKYTVLDKLADNGLFFVDCLNHVIYHPYDEGADVTALDARTIHYLYRELNEWILDFDRERIDQVFKGLGGLTR